MAKEIGSWGKASTRHKQAARASPRWTDDSRAVIAPLLAPGERLLWHARGRGPDLSGHAIYAVALFPVFAVFMAILMFVDGDPWRWRWDQAMTVLQISVFLFLFVAIWASLFALALRGFLAASHDRYGLTDRRIIIAERLWWRRDRVYTPDLIHVLEVRGSDQKGSVRLAHQRPGRVNRRHAVIGIERPAEVAELIRSTLKPDLKVKRLPEKPYIPPLEPRRPPPA